MEKKIRLDILLTELSLAESRSQAQRLVMAGQVRVNGEIELKPSVRISPQSQITIDRGPKFVSRGGEKLEAAFQAFDLQVSNQVAADVGASTGGFTDCLLQHGAAHVTAVDTGFGQIAMKLRNDPRVRLVERTNARLLAPRAFTQPGDPVLTLLVMDVSFISATLLLGPVLSAAPSLVEAVILVKPQFEAGREHVGKGGIQQ